MNTFFDNIVYKGVPFDIVQANDCPAGLDNPTMRLHTYGDDSVVVNYTLSGDMVTIHIGATDLDILDDGVIYYEWANSESAITCNNTVYTLKTPEGYDPITPAEIYESGHTAGMEDQKELMIEATIVENGVYTRPNGYSSVEVIVSGGPNVDIISTGMTVTGDVQTIESETGKAFSAVTVDATQWGNDNYGAGYVSGFTDGMVSGTSVGYDEGVAEQKAKLTSITIVENGTYEAEDGYSAVTVNISGGPSVDIISTAITMTWERQKTIESEAGTAWSAVTVYSSPTWRPYENNLYRYAKQMCYANDLEGYSFSGTYLCHVNNNQNFAAVDIGPDGEITGYTHWGMIKLENDHYYKKDDMGYTWEAWVERRHARKFLYWLTSTDISELDIYGTGHGLEMFGFPLPPY